MTNFEIRKHAARQAAEHTTLHRSVEPEDAWRTWSELSGVDDAGARLLFEHEYAECRRQSLWWQLLSAASGAPSWRRVLELGRTKSQVF
jgi:hypothetical protein